MRRTPQPTPAARQIWRDRDPRSPYPVDVVAVTDTHVVIQRFSRKVRVRRDRFTKAFTFEQQRTGRGAPKTDTTAGTPPLEPTQLYFPWGPVWTDTRNK